MPTARIYIPAKNAMRSIAQPKSWVLDFEQASPKTVEPLMGWTNSSDVRQQVRMRFDSKEEAIAYCGENGLPYRVDADKLHLLAEPDRIGAADHSHPDPTAPPSAERSCDRQAQSALLHKADTSAAVPYDPGDPKTA